MLVLSMDNKLQLKELRQARKIKPSEFDFEPYIVRGNPTISDMISESLTDEHGIIHLQCIGCTCHCTRNTKYETSALITCAVCGAPMEEIC